MANAVYDDEDTKTKQPAHDDLGQSEDERREEIKNLENDFAAPAASQSGSDKLNADQLESAEASGGTSTAAAESDQVGKGYTSKEQPKRRLWARLSGRKKAAAGGITGIIIAAIIAGSSFLSGPFQFIHLSQLLQRFHFSILQDDGNSRILKLYKWAKNVPAGTPENTRLGFIGQRVAKSFDDKFAAIGITKEYNRLGSYQGTIIDMQKFSEANDNWCRGCGPEEIPARFEEDFGFKVTPTGGEQSGLFRADDQSSVFDFLAKFKNRSFNKFLLGEVNEDGVSASIIARIMGKRDAVTWHPIQRLDSNITGKLDEQFTAWVNKIKNYVKNGAPDESVSASGSEAKDSNNKVDKQQTAENQNGADATNQVAKEADQVTSEADKSAQALGHEVDPGAGFIRQFTASTTGKVTLGVTAALGLACAADGIAKEADKLRHSLVILPLIRMGVQAMSLGSQIMSGQDINMNQLSFFSKFLTDSNGQSWAAAASIQGELGNPTTGPDMPDAYNPGKIGKNMFSQFFSYFKGIDTICRVATKGIGGFVMNVVNVVAGPIEFVGGLAIAQSGALNGVMSSVIRWVAGSPIPSLVFGANFGNFINYGSRLAANDTAASMGGAKLNPQQSLANHNYELAVQDQTISHESIAQKVFDPYSADSLAGKAFDNISPSIGNNMASIFGSLINPMKIMAVLKAPFSGTVKADSTYNYGFDEVGFSLDDMNNPKYDNPYTNGDHAKALLAGPHKDWIGMAKKCWGVDISPDGSDVRTDFSVTVDPMDKDYPNYCSSTDPDWTSLRFYVMDMKNAEAADCYTSNDQQSCQDSGFGASQDTNSVQTDSTNVYELGDSLSVGMRDSGNLAQDLKTAGWNSTIEAECGRHLASDGNNCSGTSILGGLDQVDQPTDQSAIKNAGAVIIGLGTNDPGSATFGENVQSLVGKVKALNPSAKIYWINLYSTDAKEPAYKAMDNVLNNIAPSLGVTVIDWASQAPKINAYSPNTYHPHDYTGMANFVVSQLGHAP